MCSTPFEPKRQSVGVQTRSRTSKEIKSELLPETLPVHVYISLRSCSIPHGLHATQLFGELVWCDSELQACRVIEMVVRTTPLTVCVSSEYTMKAGG